jgi:hypothetical protein
MSDNERAEQLLAQILEVQRAHLDEYKRVTSQSLELQRNAVETQNRHVRLYRRVIVGSAIVIAVLVAYAVWLSRLIP